MWHFDCEKESILLPFTVVSSHTGVISGVEVEDVDLTVGAKFGCYKLDHSCVVFSIV